MKVCMYEYLSMYVCMYVRTYIWVDVNNIVHKISRFKLSHIKYRASKYRYHRIAFPQAHSLLKCDKGLFWVRGFWIRPYPIGPVCIRLLGK